MKLFTSIALPLVALSLAIAPACGGKKPEPAPAPAAEPAKTPEPAKDPAAEPAKDPAAEPAKDPAAAEAPTQYVRAILLHADGQRPVTASFEKFAVVEANIDLSNLETAMAVIEVDASSIVTGDAKRDAHVKSADFLEIDKFAKLTITVKGLKPVEGAADTFDATATLDMHGVQKDVPVQFKVLEKKESSIVIEGGTKGLARADWGVGGEPEKVNVAPTFDAEVRLELGNVTREKQPE